MSEIAVRSFAMPSTRTRGDIFIESWVDRDIIQLVIGDVVGNFGLVLRQIEKSDPPFTSINIRFQIAGETGYQCSEWLLVAMTGEMKSGEKTSMGFDDVCKNVFDTISRALHSSDGYSALTLNRVDSSKIEADLISIENLDVSVTIHDLCNANGEIRRRRECTMNGIHPYALFKAPVRNDTIEKIIDFSLTKSMASWVRSALEIYRDTKKPIAGESA